MGVVNKIQKTYLPDIDHIILPNSIMVELNESTSVTMKID